MDFLYDLIGLAGHIIASLGITVVMNRCMKKRGFYVYDTWNCLVMAVVAFALFLTGGLSIWTCKGMVMAHILLYASVQDLSTREADDFLWVMLLILSLVNVGGVSLWSGVFGAIAVFVPQMLVAVFSKKGGVGGADIKISSAAALSLGFYGGLTGYTLGLVFAVIFQTGYNKVKKKSNKDPFPLLPFLSAGLMTGYFI